MQTLLHPASPHARTRTVGASRRPPRAAALPSGVVGERALGADQTGLLAASHGSLDGRKAVATL